MQSILALCVCLLFLGIRQGIAITTHAAEQPVTINSTITNETNENNLLTSNATTEQNMSQNDMSTNTEKLTTASNQNEIAASSNDINLVNNETSQSGDETTTITTATTTVPTTHDLVTKVCLLNGLTYKPDQCYCQMDPCLDAIFANLPDEVCPTCAVAPTETSKGATNWSTVRWQTLFTTDVEKTAANGTTEATTMATSANTAETTESNETTTIEATTTVAATTSTLLMNHDRCQIVPFGIEVLSHVPHTGVKCCCSNYSGEIITVSLMPNTIYENKSYGMNWENSLSDHRHPKTQNVLLRVGGEIVRLLRAAVGDLASHVSFEGISKSGPVGLRVNATVTMKQSRLRNHLEVRKRLWETIEKYDFDHRLGVFGESFVGYQRTSYNKLSINTWRQVDFEENSPKSNTTIMPMLLTQDDSFDWTKIAVVGGIIMLILSCLVIFLTRGTCYFKTC